MYTGVNQPVSNLGHKAAIVMFPRFVFAVVQHLQPRVSVNSMSENSGTTTPKHLMTSRISHF